MLTISGGTFSKEVRCEDFSNLIIEGGVFLDKVNYTGNSGDMLIKAGTFNGEVLNGKDGYMYISGGTFTNNIINDNIMNISNGYYAGKITNSGTMDISGGSFMGEEPLLINGVKTNISGGNFFSAFNIKKGEVSISGGDFKEGVSASEDCGKITISQGTFYGSKLADNGCFTYSGKNQVVISGGEFLEKIRLDSKEGKILIYGGTFKDDPDAFLASGYKSDWDAKKGCFVISKASIVPASGSKDLERKAQPMTVKAKVKTVKYSKVKKKAQTVKAITVKKAKGAVTYKITGGSKKGKKALKINAKTGKIKVKKNTKKGTYKIKVKITAAGNESYKEGSKTLKVTVKVK